MWRLLFIIIGARFIPEIRGDVNVTEILDDEPKSIFGELPVPPLPGLLFPRESESREVRNN